MRLTIRSLIVTACLGWAAFGAVYAAPTAQGAQQTTSLMLLDRGAYAELDARMAALQASYRAGTISDVQLYNAFLPLHHDTSVRWRAKFDAWVDAFPRSYVAHLARGDYLRRAGGDARGDQFASETTPEQFAALERFIADATRDYQESLHLDAKPILSYLGLIDMSRHGGDSQQALLDQAFKIDQKAFVIRRDYMSVLQTRWGHGVPEMEAFAADSKKAGITPSQSHLLEAFVLEDKAWILARSGDALAAAHMYQSAFEHVDDASLATTRWLGELASQTGQQYQTVSDFGNAVTWFKREVALNPATARAYSSLAWNLQKNGEAAEAASIYLKGSELGDIYAMDEYGKCLWFGLGIPKNQPAAVPYFERAAAGGSDAAKENLYWSTRQLHLAPRGSLPNSTRPAGAGQANKPMAPSTPVDAGPSES